MKEIRFLLPEDDDEFYERLILMVPENCQWVDGFLHAPRSTIEAGNVVPFAAFSFCRFGDRGFQLDEDRGTAGEQRRPQDYFALFIEGKLPEFIYFDEAGFSPGTGLTIQTAKRLAAGYVRRGYRGKLSFYLGFRDDDKYANVARCHIHLEPWEEINFENLGQHSRQPPMIIFESLEKAPEAKSPAPEPPALPAEPRLVLASSNDDLRNFFILQLIGGR